MNDRPASSVLLRSLVASFLIGTLVAALVLVLIGLFGDGGLHTEDLKSIAAFAAVVGGIYGFLVGFIATVIALVTRREDTSLLQTRAVQAGTCAGLTALTFAAFPILTVFAAVPMALLAFALTWAASGWTLRPSMPQSPI